MICCGLFSCHDVMLVLKIFNLNLNSTRRRGDIWGVPCILYVNMSRISDSNVEDKYHVKSRLQGASELNISINHIGMRVPPLHH